MVRKIILALVVLAVAVVPVPTLARDGGQAFHGGGHEFHGGHERFEHGFHGGGFGFYTPYSDDGYAPGSCYWQDGYWGPFRAGLGPWPVGLLLRLGTLG